jgi:uncharacterized coiled-coil DUF342 family protein
MVDERLAGIEAKIDGVSAGLGARMDGLSQEVGGLRQEVSGLQQAVGGLRQEVGGLRHEMHVLHEDLVDRIKALAPDFGPIRREFREADAGLKESLERRIEPLEAAERARRTKN